MAMKRTPNPRSRSRTPDDLRFGHILVPTDLTERTRKALQLVDKLASPGRTRVTLVHVIEMIEGLPFDELKPFYDRMERKARMKMNAFVHHRPAGTANADIVVVFGRRPEEVVNCAAARRVDLIVIASHRVKPSSTTRDWGTISYKVGLLAQCPVLLVK